MKEVYEEIWTDRWTNLLLKGGLISQVMDVNCICLSKSPSSLK